MFHPIGDRESVLAVRQTRQV